MKTDKLILALTGVGIATLIFLPELFLFFAGIALILQAVLGIALLVKTRASAKRHNCIGTWNRTLSIIIGFTGVSMGILIWVPELYLFFAGIALLAQGYVAARSMYLQWAAPDRPVVSLLQLEYRQ